jgi:hypothetical protein
MTARANSGSGIIPSIAVDRLFIAAPLPVPQLATWLSIPLEAAYCNAIFVVPGCAGADHAAYRLDPALHHRSPVL